MQYCYIIVQLITIFLIFLKQWPFSGKQELKLIPRTEPLEMIKIDSVFKERIERHKEELAEVEEETKIIRPPLPVSLKLHFLI